MTLKKKDTGSIILNGVPYPFDSRARSYYCPTRGLLSAALPPSTEPALVSQPGQLKLPPANHMDARLSTDAWSP